MWTNVYRRSSVDVQNGCRWTSKIDVITTSKMDVGMTSKLDVGTTSKLDVGRTSKLDVGTTSKRVRPKALQNGPKVDLIWTSATDVRSTSNGHTRAHWVGN